MMTQRKIFPIVTLIVVALAVLSEGRAQGVGYDSQSKADPFVDLRQLHRRAEVPRFLAPPPLDQRPPGLAGLLVVEVTVTGTARGPGSELVILRGIDDTSYFAREGSKLFDGFVEAVSGDEVVFVREEVDTRGNKRVTRVTKRMQTEDR
jgi:hypothetical protein